MFNFQLFHGTGMTGKGPFKICPLIKKSLFWQDRGLIDCFPMVFIIPKSGRLGLAKTERANNRYKLE